MHDSDQPAQHRRLHRYCTMVGALLCLAAGCTRPPDLSGDGAEGTGSRGVVRHSLRRKALGVAPAPTAPTAIPQASTVKLTATPPDKVCVGGTYDANPVVYGCKTNDDCPGSCGGGPEDGEPCTSNYDCNTFCAGGTNYCSDDPSISCGPDKPCPGQCAQSGKPCDNASDCGRTCAGGFNAGDTCSKQADCPGECVGGRNAGESCTGNADCAGLCEGGWQLGEVLCNADEDCPGGCELDGAACFGSHELCKDVCQGGTHDGQACQQNPADCLQGGGQCLPGCCHGPGSCQEAGHCQLKPCTNNDTCVTGQCKNGFFWCTGPGRCVDPDDNNKI